MASKKGQKVILENVELQPQVIGLAYKKKNNIGRVIFIFIAFILAIYFINDISIFFNNLLGLKTAETIKGSDKGNSDNPVNNENKTDDKNKDNVENTDLEYKVFSNELQITEESLVLSNFNIANNVLSFIAKNSSATSINLANQKYFIEIYNADKTLINRFKTDFGVINANSNMNFVFDLTDSNIYYIRLTKKTVEDYPEVELKNNENGIATITCTKNAENIVYTFINSELTKISHTITDNNINDLEYASRLTSYQNKVNNYNNITGISALFYNNNPGYTAVFNIDLKDANISNLSEKYYYSYLEKAKVVNFEMQTYGFTCN